MMCICYHLLFFFIMNFKISVIIAKFWSPRFFYIESAIVHLDFEHLFYDQLFMCLLVCGEVVASCCTVALMKLQ